MNIPPSTVSRRELSAALLELTDELFDIEDNSDEQQVMETKLIGRCLAHFNFTFQLRMTGSSAEHTKVNSHNNGSDLDIMVIPQNYTITQDALKYNKTFPCFVRVDLRHANKLCSTANGMYLPTNFVKNMEFIDGNIFPLVKKLFFNDGMFDKDKQAVLMYSSVGLKHTNFYDMSFDGLEEANHSDENDSQPSSLINIILSTLREIPNTTDKQLFGDVHKIIESVFAMECSKRIEGDEQEHIKDGLNESRNNDISDGACSSDNCNENIKKLENKNHLSMSFKRQSDADIVPALPVDGWPITASEWITRERLSPDKHIVDKIVQQGVHIVAKPLPVNPNEKIDFRLSFSLAEIILAKSWTETQRLTVVIVKACNKFAGPDELVSYHIKTAVYWISEKEPLSYWRLDNLSTCVQRVMGYLLFCVRHHFLPHYFIRHMNLFSGFDEYSFCEMEAKLLNLYHNPLRSLQGFVKRSGNSEDNVHNVEGDTMEAWRKHRFLTGRTDMNMLIKQFLHSLTNHVLSQKMPQKDICGNLAKIAAYRSRLKKLRPEDYVEDALYQMLDKKKDCTCSKSLLEEFIKHISIYLTGKQHTSS